MIINGKFMLFSVIFIRSDAKMINQPLKKTPSKLYWVLLDIEEGHYGETEAKRRLIVLLWSQTKIADILQEAGAKELRNSLKISEALTELI